MILLENIRSHHYTAQNLPSGFPPPRKSLTTVYEALQDLPYHFSLVISTTLPSPHLAPTTLFSLLLPAQTRHYPISGLCACRFLCLQHCSARPSTWLTSLKPSGLVQMSIHKALLTILLKIATPPPDPFCWLYPSLISLLYFSSQYVLASGKLYIFSLCVYTRM